ncbi:hypothetical protein PTSG_08214 [Salpingoeca rosetta]|uniref:Uncharacterized protein n=1 Tax=Salpingoeca rosetta (strain ATCC 50818 / BSB-021) TaxID=946362 RepID=F2UIB7_SALR5|nr:uncharacterized protein PTSG_08214 [Salpingoeca rosetta]EGD76866.1 hypothetical protein PTSG_08214 [Salpingoeca rosetta]|eukprot:XP_004991238.1 hypothetical protein PTSG_08214 [Salpingoeca rosetta]
MAALAIHLKAVVAPAQPDLLLWFSLLAAQVASTLDSDTDEVWGTAFISFLEDMVKWIKAPPSQSSRRQPGVITPTTTTTTTTAAAATAAAATTGRATTTTATTTPAPTSSQTSEPVQQPRCHNHNQQQERQLGSDLAPHDPDPWQGGVEVLACAQQALTGALEAANQWLVQLYC